MVDSRVMGSRGEGGIVVRSKGVGGVVRNEGGGMW